MWMCQNISKGWYIFDTHENYPVFKTLQHPCLSTSKNFPLPWPWMYNFRWAPSLKMITNQLKKKHKQRKTIICCQVILKVGLHFQYQLINLVWLPSDLFSFRWSLTIYLFVALYSFDSCCPKISQNVFYSHL